MNENFNRGRTGFSHRAPRTLYAAGQLVPHTDSNSSWNREPEALETMWQFPTLCSCWPLFQNWLSEAWDLHQLDWMEISRIMIGVGPQSISVSSQTQVCTDQSKASYNKMIFGHSWKISSRCTLTFKVLTEVWNSVVEGDHTFPWSPYTSMGPAHKHFD